MAELVGEMVQRKDRMPAFVRRGMAYLIGNQEGFLFRTALRLSGQHRKPAPRPTSVPAGDKRVLIGPANYAGQGHQWARSLETCAGVGARNLMVSVPGGMPFPADTTVPFGVYHLSKQWQDDEYAAVRGFTHVLIEAEKPILGGKFKFDLVRESAALQAAGVSVAYITHGSDTRNPTAHRELTPWSPFMEETPETAALQRLSDKNRALLSRLPGPKFVPTPDLLLDLPDAKWAPVVVEQENWRGAGAPLFANEVPRVAHIPSKGWVKGTDLIEPTMRDLHESGTVEYVQVTGLPYTEMPAALGSADIVLEQFRIGSYGATAIEAMAAGRVVVGHVVPFVREHVRSTTGIELPIVEATPDSLAEVLQDLLADRERCAALAAAGVKFAEQVHDGRMSAAVLMEHWVSLSDSPGHA